MTAALTLGAVLLGLLSAWGLAFRHDARTGRRADPIGEILAAWLERQAHPLEAPATASRRRRVPSKTRSPKGEPR